MGKKNTFLVTQKLPDVPAKSVSPLSLPEVSLVRLAIQIPPTSYGAVYKHSPQAHAPCIQVLLLNTVPVRFICSYCMDF